MDTSTNATDIDTDNGARTGTTYGLAGLCVFLVIIAIIVIIRRKLRVKDYSLEIDETVSAYHATDENGRRLSIKIDDVIRRWVGDTELAKATSDVLIESKCLSLGSMLGSGQFGCVYEGKLQLYSGMDSKYEEAPHKVAIKTLKGAALSGDMVKAFLKEGMIMKDFHHPNVLGLIGVAFDDNTIPMIVLPFMANGNLRVYISRPDLEITVRRLLMFSLEVCSGMRYLSSQKFVHRDLATRNCMLDLDLQVKVADFGLSRDIYTKEYYSSDDHRAKLPVKWMAIESLTKAVYTSKSDVWSYGVLMWELLTRGVTPYPDITNWDIRDYIQAGRRLEQPDACPAYIYDMMLRCWEEDPDDRPTFSELEQELEAILNYDVTGPDESKAQTNDLYINVTALTPPSSPCLQDMEKTFT